MYHAPISPVGELESEGTHDFAGTPVLESSPLASASSNLTERGGRAGEGDTGSELPGTVLLVVLATTSGTIGDSVKSNRRFVTGV